MNRNGQAILYRLGFDIHTSIDKQPAQAWDNLHLLRCDRTKARDATDALWEVITRFRAHNTAESHPEWRE